LEHPPPYVLWCSSELASFLSRIAQEAAVAGSATATASFT